jgi:hypothetical protein
MLGLGGGSGLGSRARIASTSAAETAKLAASRTSAYGAPSIPTRRPPMPGPAICAPLRLTSRRELPETSSSRPTSAGRYDWYATSKQTVSVPTTKPTA